MHKMNTLGASGEQPRHRDVTMSPKKKRKVGTSSTVPETKKTYYTIQLHCGSKDSNKVVTRLNFTHMIHSALSSMFGLVGETLYPYKVVSYDPQTKLGVVETPAETSKHSKFRSAITMYGGPYLNMPVRMDVMLTAEKKSSTME